MVEDGGKCPTETVRRARWALKGLPGLLLALPIRLLAAFGAAKAARGPDESHHLATRWAGNLGALERLTKWAHRLPASLRGALRHPHLRDCREVSVAQRGC